MTCMNPYKTDNSLSFGSREKCREKCNEKEHIKEKWLVTERSNTCGNVRVSFDNGNAILSNDGTQYTPAYYQISSALALYRTISLFECGLNADDVDFYKMNWRVTLKHKMTGNVLCLGEWKGAFQIFTEFYEVDQLDKKFKLDAEELLTLLVSPTLTINYDGTIAGTMA